ncbi:MAG: DUF4249 family protein [Saprospiraceae bacterium]|nr:DUF4249 family protein [Saprospiraceae bacterium]
MFMLTGSNSTWGFMVALFMTLGCAREVFIELPEEEPQVVAICHFTPGSPFYVLLTKSQSLSNTEEPELVVQGDVTISKNGQFFDRLLPVTVNKKQYWVGQDVVEAGQVYGLSVRVPGVANTISAQGSAPKQVPLAPMEINMERDAQEITLNDGTKAVRIPLTLQPALDNVTNRFFAFNIRHSIKTISGGETPVMGEVTVLQSTFITDGRASSLLYNTPEQVVLIDEGFWNISDPVLRLDVIIPYVPEQEMPGEIMVEWRTVSEDYYRYHLSIARQGNNLPLSDPDAVYNNITNGYGNFSGFSFTIDTVRLVR